MTNLTVQRAEDTLTKRDLIIRNLQSSNDNLRQELIMASEGTHLKTLVAQEKEIIEQNAVDTIAKVEKISFISDATLRNDIAHRSIQIETLTEELNGLKRTNKVLESKLRSSQEECESLQEEVKHLAFSLAHRERDMNLLIAKTSEIKIEDQFAPLENTIVNLKKELDIQKLENSRLQEMWLRNQKEVLAKSDLFERLKRENDDMKTRINITDTVKQKLLQTAEDLEKDRVDQDLEHSKLYAELGVLRPLLKETQRKNADLEFQLADALLAREEVELSDKAEIDTLKYQVRLVDGQKAEGSSQIHEMTKKLSTLERKVAVSKEMFEKVKLERSDLQRANFELNIRYGALNTKFEQLQRQFKDLSEKAEKSLKTQSQISRRPANEPDEYEILDLAGLRMRVGTLTNEKIHLSKDLELAKSRVIMLSKQLTMAENNLQANSDQNSILVSSTASLSGEMNKIKARLARAEGIAAGLEAQLKSVAPGVRIDYTVGEDPSVLLMNFISSDLPTIPTEKRYVTTAEKGENVAETGPKSRTQSPKKLKIAVKRRTSLTVE